MQLSSFCLKKLCFQHRDYRIVVLNLTPPLARAVLCEVRTLYVLWIVMVVYHGLQAPPSSSQGGTCLGAGLFLICYEHACTFYTTCF